MHAGEPSLLEDREIEAVAYAKRPADIRQVYLARRAVFYAAETRWAGAPFWSGVQRDLRPTLGELRESAAVDDFALVQN